MEELITTKRVGNGGGNTILRINKEARLLGVECGDIVEVTLKVISRVRDGAKHEERAEGEARPGVLDVAEGEVQAGTLPRRGDAGEGRMQRRDAGQAEGKAGLHRLAGGERGPPPSGFGDGRGVQEV